MKKSSYICTAGTAVCIPGKLNNFFVTTNIVKCRNTKIEPMGLVRHNAVGARPAYATFIQQLLFMYIFHSNTPKTLYGTTKSCKK